MIDLNTKELHYAINQAYASGKYTTESIAKRYGVSPRQVQRIATKAGTIRTIAESNKLMAAQGLKRYKKRAVAKPPRRWISAKVRFRLIQEHPFCAVCGKRPADGVQLEIDHIDEDNRNNAESNLQVLCETCNKGKYQHNRYDKLVV